MQDIGLASNEGVGAQTSSMEAEGTLKVDAAGVEVHGVGVENFQSEGYFKSLLTGLTFLEGPGSAPAGKSGEAASYKAQAEPLSQVEGCAALAQDNGASHGLVSPGDDSPMDAIPDGSVNGGAKLSDAQGSVNGVSGNAAISMPYTDPGGDESTKSCGVEASSPQDDDGTPLGKARAGGKRCQMQGCETASAGSTGYCVAHGGGKRCQVEGCTTSAKGNTLYCVAHGGGKRCQVDGCPASAAGSTPYCVAHGGGKRCQASGCAALAARGGSPFCVTHGGGKRCQVESCSKLAAGSTPFCIAHGGGKRCQMEGCPTSAARGSTPFCTAHGGGKRCEMEGCTTLARGSTSYCIAHGGGKRCQAEGCSTLAAGGSPYCKAHGGGKRCQIEGCSTLAASNAPFCVAHGGNKHFPMLQMFNATLTKPSTPVLPGSAGPGLLCVDFPAQHCAAQGCSGTCALNSPFCTAHAEASKQVVLPEGFEAVVKSDSLFCSVLGGMESCRATGCASLAQAGSAYCVMHGGDAKQCLVAGCTAAARGSSPLCSVHAGSKVCQTEGRVHLVSCWQHAALQSPWGREAVPGGWVHDICPGKHAVLCCARGGKRCQVDGCTTSAQGRTPYCVAHGGGKRCQADGCAALAARGSSVFCVGHGGGKRCQVEGCAKLSAGSSRLCVAHGGGKRCQAEGCQISAARGAAPYCKSHGGGRRCDVEGCTTLARGSTLYCVAHGGGKRCRGEGCGSLARGRTPYCKAHGGGNKLCETEGCAVAAVASGTLCKMHGGGGIPLPVALPVTAVSAIAVDGYRLEAGDITALCMAANQWQGETSGVATAMVSATAPAEEAPAGREAGATVFLSDRAAPALLEGGE
ncbi:hypothetical protein CYMTET_34986 [Cymbomonas tetramitiformis]|uniref:WRKY19-like zinc finger domain-containing protein n=1 Tax=Cymbomonas tetramitiformis TaxID=36881 RepID=A0AAE0KPC5_9CHLO|nr:hypothetical protein CYMTET_34986 [Cymbomonas tetramitiformis]